MVISILRRLLGLAGGGGVGAGLFSCERRKHIRVEWCKPRRVSIRAKQWERKNPSQGVPMAILIDPVGTTLSAAPTVLQEVRRTVY